MLQFTQLSILAVIICILSFVLYTVATQNSQRVAVECIDGWQYDRYSNKQLRPSYDDDDDQITCNSKE